MTPPPGVLHSLAQTDEAARVRLGANTGTAATVMQALATDPSATVRATLAMNPATPPQVDRALANDSDERVRILLARKLSALAPNLSADARMRLQRQALETLTGLVVDEAVRVRAVIAEAVKDLPDAPRAIILRLAQDRAVMVCEPVIRFSPLLTQHDLLALLAAAPSPATVMAVARRQAIDETVTDAIAATANSEAIRVLLENHSAQIREATLDALVARAVEHVEWHAPLVHRPFLPHRTARALSEIVTTHLLQALAARTDLDSSLIEELRRRLTERLAQAMDPPANPDAAAVETAALAAARAQKAAGALTEATVLEAVRGGDPHVVSVLLAVASGVPVSVVERAASLRSTKGLVSLAWRAGFSMRAAVGLQTLLARLSPAMVLQPGPGGSFPLAVEEMRWQLDFLGRVGR